MIERRIVRRYASALFSAAFKAEVVDRIESDLGLVTYALEMSPDMLEAVRSPRSAHQRVALAGNGRAGMAGECVDALVALVGESLRD